MFFMVLGALIIIAVLALLAFVIIKIWLNLLDSLEKDQEKSIRSTKKEGYKFLYTLLRKDYDTEKYDVIARVTIISIVLCIAILYVYFSVATSLL